MKLKIVAHYLLKIIDVETNYKIEHFSLLDVAESFCSLGPIFEQMRYIIKKIIDHSGLYAFMSIHKFIR